MAPQRFQIIVSRILKSASRPFSKECESLNKHPTPELLPEMKCVVRLVSDLKQSSNLSDPYPNLASRFPVNKAEPYPSTDPPTFIDSSCPEITFLTDYRAVFSPLSFPMHTRSPFHIRAISGDLFCARHRSCSHCLHPLLRMCGKFTSDARKSAPDIGWKL